MFSVNKSSAKVNYKILSNEEKYNMIMNKNMKVIAKLASKIGTAISTICKILKYKYEIFLKLFSA